jgi:hypothetical protein
LLIAAAAAAAAAVAAAVCCCCRRGLLLLLLLQAAGERGQRFSMKNTRIMMTQPMGELALVNNSAFQSSNRALVT